MSQLSVPHFKLPEQWESTSQSPSPMLHGLELEQQLQPPDPSLHPFPENNKLKKNWVFTKSFNYYRNKEIFTSWNDCFFTLCGRIITAVIGRWESLSCVTIVSSTFQISRAMWIVIAVSFINVALIWAGATTPTSRWIVTSSCTYSACSRCSYNHTV